MNNFVNNGKFIVAKNYEKLSNRPQSSSIKKRTVPVSSSYYYEDLNQATDKQISQSVNKLRASSNYTRQKDDMLYSPVKKSSSQQRP